jgi:hypothetical protein
VVPHEVHRESDGRGEEHRGPDGNRGDLWHREAGGGAASAAGFRGPAPVLSNTPYYTGAALIFLGLIVMSIASYVVHQRTKAQVATKQ